MPAAGPWRGRAQDLDDVTGVVRHQSSTTTRIAVTRALSVASGSRIFQPKRHQLVVAQARQRRADPDEEEDEDAHLHDHDDRLDPVRLIPERDVPAAEEERHDQAGDHDHVQVLRREERREAAAAVLRVVAADELGVGLGEVERRAVGLGEAGDHEDQEADELRADHPEVRLLPLDDVDQRQRADHHDHADEREALGDLVGDQLRGGAHRAEEASTSSPRPSRRASGRRRRCRRRRTRTGSRSTGRRRRARSACRRCRRRPRTG